MALSVRITGRKNYAAQERRSLLAEDHAEGLFPPAGVTRGRDWPQEQLIRWKHSWGIRASVVIPALDEEETVPSKILSWDFRKT
jgi:hypothetical protein